MGQWIGQLVEHNYVWLKWGPCFDLKPDLGKKVKESVLIKPALLGSHCVCVMIYSICDLEASQHLKG